MRFDFGRPPWDSRSNEPTSTELSSSGRSDVCISFFWTASKSRLWRCISDSSWRCLSSALTRCTSSTWSLFTAGSISKAGTKMHGHSFSRSLNNFSNNCGRIIRQLSVASSTELYKERTVINKQTNGYLDPSGASKRSKCYINESLIIILMNCNYH